MSLKKTTPFILIAAIFFCILPLSHAKVVDKILVIINDEIITQGEVDRILISFYRQYQKLYSGIELAERIDAARRGVIEGLIRDKLLLGEAKKQKIEVTEVELDTKMEEVRKRFAGERELKTMLAKENLLMSDLERSYKERIMIDKLIESEITKNVSISPRQIMDYYANNKDRFREPKKVKLRAILIRVNDDRSEEKARKLAKLILGRLQEGGNFAILAERYSEGPYRTSGGDMGWVSEGQLMERINYRVFSLEENELSGILQTKLGFHIFLVEEKMSPRLKTYRETKRKIENILYNQQIEEKLAPWLEELKKNAYIAFR